MSKRKCAVDDCGNDAVSRMYCRKHANSSIDIGHPDLNGIDDMVMLTSKQLSNAGITENLQLRFGKDVIYTYIGAVLVAVNPFKRIDMYNEKTIKRYINKAIIDVAPHIFGIAESAYRGMVSEEENQCIIISGESGAGKTEASKHIQNYIAAVSSGGKDVEHIKKVFLDSNPLLEAFGNAKTLRNNNSSRFGKYFELMFDPQGTPKGGKVNNYLLEKSRIVRPGKKERGFHIFYQLLAGAPEQVKSALFISGKPDDYEYLKQSECTTVAGMNDAEEFDATFEAMKTLNIKPKEITEILRLVALVLHLGNLRFKPVLEKNSEGSEIAKEGGSKKSLKAIEDLMGVDAKALEVGLTSREMKTKDEQYTVKLNVLQATAARDALAKSLYADLFDFLVNRVNSALAINEKSLEGIDPDELISIGVLDIYGFEIFESNGFEQFCINYVNEKLQQIFIEVILRGEQEEYEREGIEWDPIPFDDNKVVCELIEGKRPPGLFLLLDDTCKAIHAQSEGVDDAFLNKAKGQHASHKHFRPGKGGFVVKHYAGEVRYVAEGFCRANKDQLLDGLIEILRNCNNILIKHLQKGSEAAATKSRTMGAIIAGQCGALVEALMKCQPHYVRCMKSNDEKKAGIFDKERMLHQVKYLGLEENIKVRRAGFAYRDEFCRFLDRFKLLGGRKTYPYWKGKDKEGVKVIIDQAFAKLTSLNKAEEVRLGKNMVFIKKPETFYLLENLKNQIRGEYASKIQRQFRKFRSRKWFIKLRNWSSEFFTKKKERRRDSFSAPYMGTYLSSGEQVKMIKNIVKFLAKEGSERILFLDKVDKLVPSKSPPGYSSVNKVFCVTNLAVYLLEVVNAPIPLDKNSTRSKAPPKGSKKVVVLKRRVKFTEIDGLVVSPLCDNILVLRVTPKPKRAEPDVSNWLPDKESDTCMMCGHSFGLFNRRHHCRCCGKLFCATCSEHLMKVPDLGHYTATRACSECATSVVIQQEMMEDWVLVSGKKIEIVSIIRDSYKEATRRDVVLDFSDRVRLRPAAILSETFDGEISFRKVESRGTNQHISSDGKSLSVEIGAGIPQSEIDKIKKDREEKRKAADKKAKKEMERRREEAAARAAEREEQRKQRIALRKAAKEAKRQKRQDALKRRGSYGSDVTSVKVGGAGAGDRESVRAPASASGGSRESTRQGSGTSATVASSRDATASKKFGGPPPPGGPPLNPFGAPKLKPTSSRDSTR